MRGCPAMVLVTTMVSCLEGFEESQSDAMVSAGGEVSEKNRCRLDAGDNRSMKFCIRAWSSAEVGRRDAVEPSRRMTGPDSRLPDAGGGWNKGRICFMPGHPLDLLRSILRSRRSFRSFPALPGLQHSKGLEENILGFLLKQVRRAVIVLNRPAWGTPFLCRGSEWSGCSRRPTAVRGLSRSGRAWRESLLRSCRLRGIQ